MQKTSGRLYKLILRPSKNDVWIIVERTDHIKNVLPSTLAFKIKQDSDRMVEHFKGWFRACGDKQVQGVDFYKTTANHQVDVDH